MSLPLLGNKKVSKRKIEQEMRRVGYSLQKRLEEQERFARYRKNPDIWLKERFGEEPKSIIWEYFGGYDLHDWDGDKNPLYAMWKALADKKWCGATSGTGTGKTFILARIVYWFLDCYPDKAKVITSAPKEKQLLIGLWKEMNDAFDKFERIRPFCKMTTLKLVVDARKKTSSFAEGFVAGTRANEESTTKAQGIHAANMLILCEETPGIPQPTINAFVKTSTAKNNLILAVGNPDSQHDALSQFITTYSKVIPIRISGLDHPNVVNDKDYIQGAVTNDSIQVSLDAENGNKEGFMYKSRVQGIIPEQSEDSLIKYSWLVAQTINPLKYDISELEMDNTMNALGVDPAQSKNGDKVCLVWGRANIVLDINEFQCDNADHLAYNLIWDSKELAKVAEERKIAGGITDYKTKTIHDYGVKESNIGVDAVGLGLTTVNAFSNIGVKCLPIKGGQNDERIPKDKNTKKNMFEFASLRAQIYWWLANDLQNGRIFIYMNDKKVLAQLYYELTSIRKTMHEGKFKIEPKPALIQRIGHSPNMADALAYWNWARRFAGGKKRKPILMY